jgi:excinuclease ABC subunit A
MGPGAGIHGGEIVATGVPEEVLKSKNSLTADYLTGRKSVPLPEKRRSAKPISTASGQDGQQFVEI